MRKRTGYLIRRGKVFYACWHVGGKLFMQTTGKKDRRDAETELHRIMEPFVAGDEVATLQNIAARIEGRTAEIARIEDERNPPLTIANAATAYERAGDRKDISPGTRANYAGYWRAFSGWLADKHPDIKQLREVSFELCEEYKAHMSGLKVTGRTFNANRAFLRAFWNTLSDKAKLTTLYQLPDGRETRNPWAKIAKRDEHSLSRRPLTVKELRRVCQSAEGELRIMLAFGLYLGARLGDACCMTWGNVDMFKRLVSFVPRKTARKNPEPLLIPMHPELYAVLSETPPAERTGYVTPDAAKLYLAERANVISKKIQAHFEKCGVVTTAERAGFGVKRTVIAGFHSLRHNAVSFLQQAGAAQSVSQAVVGHNAPEVHRLYSHVDADAMRRAVNGLPNVWSKARRKALPAGRTVAAGAVKTIAEGMTAKTWKEKRAELLALVG